MDLVDADSAFCFNYVDFGQDDSLFVRAEIYDVTSGTAVFLQYVVMDAVGVGLYSGNFTGDSGKTYLIISLIYTDGTYTTPDPDRAPNSHCIQVIGLDVTYFAFSFAAFNQLETLAVADTVYNLSSGLPVFVEKTIMSHVAHGVYFGGYTGSINQTYQVLSVVYTDGSLLTPDDFYAPGCESFQGIIGNDSPVFLKLAGAALVGQSLSAKLIGQNTESVLVGQSAIASLTGQALDANLKGQSLKAQLTGESP